MSLSNARRHKKEPRILKTAWRAVGLAFVGLLYATCFTSALAMVATRQPLPDFDAGGGLQISGPEVVRPGSAQEQSWRRLERRAGAPLLLRFNARTGVPRIVGATRPLSGPSGDAPERTARDFLTEHRALWGFSMTDLDQLHVQASYSDPHSGLTHVYFRQMVNGIPVFPANLGLHLDGRGRVLGAHGDVFPGLQVRGDFRITPEEAAEAAASQVGVDFVARRRTPEGSAVVLEPGTLRSPVRVHRTFYALSQPVRPAYRMLIEKNGLEWYDMIVDARTGELLHRRNLYQFTGALTPSAPAETDPAPPRGLIYVEHPLATVRGTGDLARRYPLTVDPTGRPRGFANAPVNGADSSPTVPHGPSPQNATLPPAAHPLPDAAAPARSNALPLSTSPQSPQGWFVLQSGDYRTIGNNVDAKDDRADDDEGSIGFRPNGGPTGDFSTPEFEYENVWGQGGDAVLDLNAAVLDLFYVANWYHDFLYHLGFTEAAGNFQLDNFGRGGKGNDYVFADAQDGSGTNNANFGTPDDGASPRMQMYLWTGPNRDGDLDFDVIVHEYTHGLSNRLVGGPDDTGCLGIGLVGESGGMGEGWGDWFAGVLSDDSAVAEYATGAPEGLRRFPMDRTPGDWTYAFLCSGPPSNPSTPCEVHDIGELWAGILWELRESFINRVHNRAHPGGPTFPTFLVPAGSPGSNIRNAEGRTTDGSGNPSMLDHATIENASFAAMFRVVDGMKLSVCNPTMVDMRDAILAADRAVGGGFQDVIWRVFANRGIGEGAFSTGGEAPTTVEDFSVPATVEACEAAGGPLPEPAFTATSTVDNVVDLSITPDGAAEHVIFRGTAGAGTAIEPRPFVEIGRTSGTTFTDTGLDGGTTYTYRVRSTRNDDCVSESNAVSVVVAGSPLECVTPPAFAGAAEAADAEDCEHVDLRWNPASSQCASGPEVSYNIYRDTDPGFVPGAGNRIATGVTGTTFRDGPGTADVIHYYIVRAEDSTSEHGGPANDGNEDGNEVRVTALLTSPTMINQNLADDVESGPDELESDAGFVSSGFTVSGTPERGGWFRDADPDPASAHSGTTVWHTFDPDNRSISPSGSGVYELIGPLTSITPSSILTFHHTFQTEATFDGGVVEAAVVDPQTGLLGAFEDIGHLIYENGYNGALDASGSDNTLAGRPGYTGGILGPMKRSRAFLGALVPDGETSAEVVVRFLFGSDVANTITVPPVFEGQYYPGWYLDDISIDDPCCPLSPPAEDLTASATGDNEVTLQWSPPASGSIGEYRIFRVEAGDTIPSRLEELLATVPGTETSFLDTDVSGGTTYAYMVRAVPTDGCPSGDSNVATVVATGVCRLAPAFDGLASLSSPLEADCSLDLSWEAATARCAGASVRYNVYRSTDPGFTPAPSDLIAIGFTGLMYRDRDDLADGTTYTYVVRAEDTTNGGTGPAAGGNEDENLVRLAGTPQGALAPSPDFVDDVESGILPGYEITTTRTAGTWDVTPDATASSPSNAWFALDDQPGVPTLTPRDDRLMLPPMHLTSTSQLTFFHNFDFAQRTTDPADIRYHSGGVLEISGDGSTWVDLGPYITSGGYNGLVNATAESPVAGRMAWVGSSDAVPGSRTDLMTGHAVTVDLGAAVTDPALFDATDLPDARIRFRLGGTFQIIVGGIQGTGWGIDDLQVSGLLAPGACTTLVPVPAGSVPDGESGPPLLLYHAEGGGITLTWGLSCSEGDDDYEVYEGTIGDFAGYAPRACSTGGATEMTLPPEGDRTYYLVVPRTVLREGSYGRDGAGLERPRAASACVLQEVTECP